MRIAGAVVTLAWVASLPAWGTSAVLDTITVSGVITGPSGPAANVEVAAWIPYGAMTSATSDANGHYQLSIEQGNVHMNVRAPLGQRLGERFFVVGEVTADLELDIQLEAGHLLAGTVRLPDGRPVFEPMQVELTPLPAGFRGPEWLTAEVSPVTGTFEVVAPARVHWISAQPSRQWYGVPEPVDLSAADVTNVTLHLSRNPVNPLPTEPPDATRITVGPIDGLGEATVTGSPGAVSPLSQVLLVNLDSSHQAAAVADDVGAFSASLFAPPGSAILVKHGPASIRWIDLDSGVAQSLNQLPSTIFHVPLENPGGPGTPFSTVGSIDVVVDDVGETANSVGASWWIEGRILPGSGPFAPGDTFHVEGSVTIFSHGLAGSSIDDIAMRAFGGLTLIFDREGEAVALGGSFMSTMLTPTGLPIQGFGRTSLPLDVPPIVVEDFQRAGDYMAEGHFEAEVMLPVDTPAGTYLPGFFVDLDNVPTTTDWPAAHVFASTFGHEEAVLPPITVDDGSLVWDGDQPRRHLIWRLLMESPILGIRGTGAADDASRFQFASQIVTQGAPFIAPPLDRAADLPLRYRLEPYLPMVSYTDRRLPGPPMLQLELPGGSLHAIVEDPEGELRELGPVPFRQALTRTGSTTLGHDLNPGTTQCNDVYSLTTGEDAFWVEFDRYGPHHVFVDGIVEDRWGNRYSGGGVYPIWVAYPLDLDPGVLPGTPLAVGDSIDPSVRVTPPVPAQISWTVTLMPESDPDRARVHTVTGHANEYGTFAGADPLPVMDQPGEYRVDLVARYEDSRGALHMGAMTWGGIVMTPPADADLVAHGRRGLDSLEYVPASWFVAGQDLVIPDGAVSHSFNPYFGGDLLWSRMSDGPYGGDALLIVGTVHDTVGNIQDAIERRLGHIEDPLMPERIAAGELPLFVTTTGGRPPTVFPEEIDQVAYSYRSSQRPGVRVREVISQDSETGGYWRLDTQYDSQPGVGFLGDQVNDFKFQYVGVVYRDLVTGHNEYVGQGTGWVFLPDDDPVGTRVMPPFAGSGNGGWTTLGGPIMTLKGDDVDVFLLPTGVRPGTVLTTGDTLRIAGHVMPTLPSQVAVTITSPSGTEFEIDGEANPIGYFEAPGDPPAVLESGPWSVQVAVWHEGQCSGGTTVPPFPSGDVLGSDRGTFWVYVVPPDTPALELTSPRPGLLRLRDSVPTIPIRGLVPDGFDAATVHYTIAMPGFILDSGQVAPRNGRFEIMFDPTRLNAEFPNLDLVGRDDGSPGLSDTIWVGILLEGTVGGERSHRAAVVTFQGEEVSVGDSLPRPLPAPREGGARLP